MAKDRKCRPKTHFYSKEDLRKCLEAVRAGTAIRQAAKIFHVPRSTIHNKITGKVPEDSLHGKPTTLTREMELELVEWILGCAEKWQPITKDQVLDSVQLMCQHFKIPNKFTNGRPGDVWYRSFLKRHPELRQRTAENFTVQRASVSHDNLKRWFTNVGEYLEQHNLLDLPSSRVFNCDESAFFLAPDDQKVLARRGARVVGRVITSGEKECLTVLFTVSAAGDLAPPMTVHKCVRLSQHIADNNAEGWGIGKSLTGWMNGPLFYEYIANTFYKWLVEQGTEFPIILYLDGHASHVTLELSKFCESKGIVLILLFPNATHLMQPLDTAFFRPLKSSYKRAVVNWRMRNNGDRLKPNHVSNVICDALKTLNLEEIAANGFRGCGLYPFNPNAINTEKILDGSQVVQSANNVQVSRTDLAETTISAADYEVTLRVLQNHLSTTTLQKFNECKDTVLWDGPAEYEKMFYFWRDIKHLNERNESLEFSTESRGNFMLEGSEEMETIGPFQTVQVRSQNESFSSSPQNFSLLETSELTSEQILSQDKNVIMIEIPSASTFVEADPISTVSTDESLERLTAPEEIDRDKNPVEKFLQGHFWPGDLPKKKTKTQTLSVITSKEWQSQQQEKRDRLKKIQMEKETRKKEREEKKKIRETEALEKRRLRLLKRQLKNESIEVKKRKKEENKK